MKKILKLLTAFLVLSLAVSVIPLPAKAETDAERYATWISRTPEEMRDNAALRALEKTLKFVKKDVDKFIFA